MAADVSTAPATPVEVSDPINAAILAVSEDRIAGFVTEPFKEIAFNAELPESVVIERLRAMLQAGVVRRIRQTLMATNLAPGALVAWRVPSDKLDSAFSYMVRDDPFSGHVVIRSTDAETPGSVYRLWTTLKVPQGFSMKRHCEFLAAQVGGDRVRLAHQLVVADLHRVAFDHAQPAGEGFAEIGAKSFGFSMRSSNV